MQKFKVTGMTCAACSARVEKAVSSVQGVDSCTVNLLTNSMGVEGKATAEEIIKAVEKAGYKAFEEGKGSKQNKNQTLEDTETPKLLKRFTASLVFLFPLMYVSMGHTMLGLPLPSVLENNLVAIGLIQLLLSIAVHKFEF